MNATLPAFDVTQAALRNTTERLAHELLTPSDQAPPWGEFDWGVARAVAVMHGICSLLANRTRWRGPAPWLQFLELQRRQALARDAQIGATLAELDGALRTAGIGVVALKGSALRPLGLYAAGERPQADIDLLTQDDTLPGVAALLDGLGYACTLKMKRHHVFQRRTDKRGWIFGEHPDNPLKIEVHTRISEPLPATPVDITARLMPPLEPGLNPYRDTAALLLHLALHTAGNMRAHALRFVQAHDIALLAARLSPAQWDEIANLPAASGGSWWMIAPFALVERYHPGTFPPELIAMLRRRAPMALRRALADQTLTEVSWSNLGIHAFPGMEFARTPLEALRFARTRIAPKREALDELAAGIDTMPLMRLTGWYESSHWRRILRWVFGKPPRVQTLVTLGASLEAGPATTAADGIPARRWPHATAPRRILAIRLQALGDTLITLPYLLGLRRRYPGAELHFLTRQEVAAVPGAMAQFDRVVALGGGRSRFRTWMSALAATPALLAARYDVVLDLQNSRISNFLRRAIRPEAWSEFDRFSPRPAGERTRRTIAAALGADAGMDTSLALRGDGPDVDALLHRHGWKTGFDLVVLNPAGFSPARAWPTANYIEFARLWIERYPRSQIVLLLLPSKRAKATEIATALGEHCIDLTGRADQLEAFAIVRRARLVLSEDSGLMHMAWTQGTPTLALFSDSRRDWSAPQGSWSDCLDSSDLPCGPCGLEVCKFGDNRCLTRYSASLVMEHALRLVRPEVAKCG